MENTFKDSFVFITAAMADCAITIEDSDILSGGISYSSSKSNNDTTINVIFRNIDIFSSGVNLNGSAALFVNCTFENNTGISPIYAVGSKVIFQGNNIFRNNSALVGAGVSLKCGSYNYLLGTTHPHPVRGQPR